MYYTEEIATKGFKNHIIFIIITLLLLKTLILLERPDQTEQENYFRGITAATLCEGLNSALGGDPSLHRLAIVSQAIAKPEVLIPLIDSYLRDKKFLDAFARNSYQITGFNEGGEPSESFHALVLATGHEDEWQCPWDMRIHMWDASQNGRLTQDVHTHAAPFVSTVLTETFADVISVEDESGTPHFVYNDATNIHTGIVNLVDQPERTVPRGTSHVMPTSLIHRATFQPKEMTSTLVVRGRRQHFMGTTFTQKPRTTTAPEMAQIDAEASLRRFRYNYANQ